MEQDRTGQDKAEMRKEVDLDSPPNFGTTDSKVNLISR